MSDGSPNPANSLAALKEKVRQLEVDLRKTPTGIWLEVAEFQFDTEKPKPSSRVQLKGDRAYPKPTWWPVDSTAAIATTASGISTPYENYKAILNEMDKKRVVLARLTWKDGELLCDAFRFQSPDLGSRSS